MKQTSFRNGLPYVTLHANAPKWIEAWPPLCLHHRVSWCPHLVKPTANMNMKRWWLAHMAPRSFAVQRVQGLHRLSHLCTSGCSGRLGRRIPN